MNKRLRGGTHTTLTETAALIVKVLETFPNIKKISPGIISKNNVQNSKSFLTAVFTNAGLELIITGQGVQKIAVHASPEDAKKIFLALKNHKKLAHLSCKTRERKPGI